MKARYRLPLPAAGPRPGSAIHQRLRATEDASRSAIIDATLHLLPRGRLRGPISYDLSQLDKVIGYALQPSLNWLSPEMTRCSIPGSSESDQLCSLGTPDERVLSARVKPDSATAEAIGLHQLKAVIGGGLRWILEEQCVALWIGLNGGGEQAERKRAYGTLFCDHGLCCWKPLYQKWKLGIMPLSTKQIVELQEP